MADDLRKKLIRLAHAKPELRPHLLPLVKQAASIWTNRSVQEMVLRSVRRALRSMDAEVFMRAEPGMYTGGEPPSFFVEDEQGRRVRDRESQVGTLIGFFSVGVYEAKGVDRVTRAVKAAVARVPGAEVPKRWHGGRAPSNPSEGTGSYFPLHPQKGERAEHAGAFGSLGPEHYEDADWFEKDLHFHYTVDLAVFHDER